MNDLDQHDSYPNLIADELERTLGDFERGDLPADDEVPICTALVRDLEQARLLLDFAAPERDEAATFARLAALLERATRAANGARERLLGAWKKRQAWLLDGHLPAPPSEDADEAECASYLQDRHDLALALAGFERVGADTSAVAARLGPADQRAAELVRDWPLTTEVLHRFRLQYGLDERASRTLQWLADLIASRGADGSGVELDMLIEAALPKGPLAPLEIEPPTELEQYQARRALAQVRERRHGGPSEAAAGALAAAPRTRPLAYGNGFMASLANSTLPNKGATLSMPAKGFRLAASSVARGAAPAARSTLCSLTNEVRATLERDHTGSWSIDVVVDEEARVRLEPLETMSGPIQPRALGPGLWRYELGRNPDPEALVGLTAHIGDERHRRVFDLFGDHEAVR